MYKTYIFHLMSENKNNNNNIYVLWTRVTQILRILLPEPPRWRSLKQAKQARLALGGW